MTDYNKYNAEKNSDSTVYGRISVSLDDNISLIKSLTSDSSDITFHKFIINETACATLTAEGMVNSFYFSEILSQSIYGKLPSGTLPDSSSELLAQLQARNILSPDQKEFSTIDELFSLIYSGFGILLIDKCSSGIAFGVQGFATRSVGNPSTNENIKGSKESFTEALKVNQSLLRRRIKSPELVFENMNLGKISSTTCSIVYMKNFAAPAHLKSVREKLSNADIDMVLESGSIKIALLEKPFSLFSEIGSTERPDTLAKHLYEGKIGIIVDGTPFVLILPFLFAEHFHSLDDFEFKTVYSNFIRFLKYSAFIISMILPGMYVAVATFHPEVLSSLMRAEVIDAGNTTPYSFLIEALIIHFAYEIMREAGLRLPKEIGHAVSIVGGLIIGDAAISAGIVSAPMVIIAAVSAISSFVIPSLMDSLVIMRFVNIILGGLLGLPGVSLGAAYTLINICAKYAFGVPFSSAVSPFTSKTFESFLYKKAGQQFASGKVPKITDMPGSLISDIPVSDSPEYISSGKLFKTRRCFFIAYGIIAGFGSLAIYTVFINHLVLRNIPPVFLPMFLILSVFITRYCDEKGFQRSVNLASYFFIFGILLSSFYFIYYGMTYTTFEQTLLNENVFLLLIPEVLLMLPYFIFCRETNLCCLLRILLINLLSLLINFYLGCSGLSHSLPFAAFAYTGFEYLKLLFLLVQAKPYLKPADKANSKAS